MVSVRGCVYYLCIGILAVGCTKVEGRRRLLLSSQSWFSRACLSYAPVSESSWFWSMSRHTWVCRGTSSGEERLAMVENTSGKFVCHWWCGQVKLWWSSSIYWGPPGWYFRFCRQAAWRKAVVVASRGSFSVLGSMYQSLWSIEKPQSRGYPFSYACTPGAFRSDVKKIIWRIHHTPFLIDFVHLDGRTFKPFLAKLEVSARGWRPYNFNYIWMTC